MKRYTTKDLSLNGIVMQTDVNLSLLEVLTISDWSEKEFDMISELKIGEVENFNGITVERTE